MNSFSLSSLSSEFSEESIHSKEDIDTSLLAVNNNFQEVSNQVRERMMVIRLQ